MKRVPFLILSIAMMILALAILAVVGTLIWIPEQAQYAPKEAPVPMLPYMFVGIIAAGFITWISGLIHMLKNERLQGTDKIVWTLVIIFLNVGGAVLYFLIRPWTSQTLPSTVGEQKSDKMADSTQHSV